MDLRQIDWKDGNSRTEILENGDKFQKVFVPIEDVSALREEHHLFIWGMRGMGKTALAWHHARECASNIRLLLQMDFEEAEDWMNSIIQKIIRFAEYEGFPAMKFIEDAWYQAVLTEVMRRLQKEGKVTAGNEAITKYIRSQRSDRHITQGLVRKLEGIDDLLLKHGGLVSNATFNGLKVTSKGLLLLEDYFQKSNGFQEALEGLRATLKSFPRQSILIVVDSVDKFLMPVSFPDAPKEHRSLCTAIRGLCRALLKLYNDQRFSKVFQVKVFLPLDMKNSMKDRSYEHEFVYHHNIRWTADELAFFLAKRLKAGQPSESDARAVAETWDTLFPYSVTNGITGVKHRTLDYLLRHTQYRPRQLIFCCRAMTEHARRAHKKQLDAAEFSVVIHEYCRESSGRILNEFKASYPAIFDVVHKFESSSNVLTGNDVYNILGGNTFSGMTDDVHDLVQLLYDIGFLGVVKDEEHVREMGLTLPYTTTHSKTYYFVFSYLHPRFSVIRENLFVIHPSFYSRFNFKIDQELTVAQNANFTKLYRA